MSEYGSPPPSYQPTSGAGAGVTGPKGGMGRRLGARLIDGLIIGAVYTVLSFTLLGGAAGSGVFDESTPTGEPTAEQAGFIATFVLLFAVIGVLTLLYEVSLIAIKGATLGKMAVKLKVVRADTGALPGWGPSAIRWVIPQIGGLLCGIGQIVVYLSPFFDGSGQERGWHDKAASTIVIRTD